MKIGPKYKIARRLGAPVFEKTQTQKFAIRESNKKNGKPKTDYGLQMNEKQKARMFYAISEKQFAKYVLKSLENKKVSPADALYSMLESRIDNIIWRVGLAPTHLAARQRVAHGHFLVNGKKCYTPSLHIKKGDKIEIREGSKNSKMFDIPKDKMIEIPNWIIFEPKTKTITLKEAPVKTDMGILFDLGQVIEFYQR